MGRLIGMREFMEAKFEFYELENEWKDAIGQPEKNFKMIIWGVSGQGKTTFTVKLVKYLSEFARVYYNSFEEGKSKTLQDCFARENMIDCIGRVFLANKDTYDEMVENLKKRHSAQIVVIDSRDDMELTYQQWKKLTEMFPRKAFVTICWGKGDSPRGEYGKAIRYKSDIKIMVHGFTAYPTSRYGGNKPFKMPKPPQHPPKEGEQTTLFST